MDYTVLNIEIGESFNNNNNNIVLRCSVQIFPKQDKREFHTQT